MNPCCDSDSLFINICAFVFMPNEIFLNLNFKNWNIKTCNQCSFCNEEPEPVLHLLIECDISEYIWDTLWVKLNTILGSGISLTKSEQMLGSINNLYNHICAIVKHYIYVCRCVAKRQ